MYLRSLCRLLCLVLLLSVGTSLHSQTTAPDSGNAVTTIKTKVRVVLVDVVVTNGKGEAVTGLQKGDFEVLEDGKPQTISTFEEHQGAPPAQINLPPMPPHVYTNFPLTQTSDSVNVLLLDALNTPTVDQAYVRKQMIGYLKQLPPSTRIAIFTLAARLRMLQGVTTDSSELLAALNVPEALPHPSGLLQSDAEINAYKDLVGLMNENSGMRPPPSTLAAQEVDLVTAAREFMHDVTVFTVESRVLITLQAMQQLARYLASVPGRKNVIWFSGSFPAAMLPNLDLPDHFRGLRDFAEEIRRTADLLTEARVAIYPIAAEGLATDSMYQANANRISQVRPMDAMQDQIQASQAEAVDSQSKRGAMEELAKDTGGKAYYNTNGLTDALACVVKDGTRYYTLTYPPKNATANGKFRHIQVKLLKGQGALSYRRGYYADDPESVLASGQKPDSDPLLPLMGRNLPQYTQILYKILVQPSNPQPPADAPRIGGAELKGPFIRYGVDFAISVEDLKLETTSDGARHGMVEVALIAYDREGKPLNLVATTGDVRLNPKEYASVQKGGLQIHKEIDVPTQYIYLRTGIYDLRSGTAGTLGVPLTDITFPTAK